MSRNAVILFAHGSRDPSWVLPFETIRNIVQRECPESFVDMAFLEIMQPTLLLAIDKLHNDGVTDVTIAPLFLAPGMHVAKDLPQLVQHARQMYPGMTFRTVPSLGEASELLEEMGKWIAGKVQGKNRV